jgi:hypothetical protein
MKGLSMKRIHLSWLAAAALVGLAAGGSSPAQDRPGDLPADEAKLLEYAQQRMNHGQWREADRAYKALVERFPDSRRLEHVYHQLGNLHHWYSRRPAEAREWYGRLVEKFPKSPNLWSWRSEIAQTYASQNLRDKAVEEYMKIGKEAPDAAVRAGAIQQAWNLKGKYLTLQVNQTFTAGSEPFANVNLQGIDKVAYRATRIGYDALLKHLEGPDGANLHEAIARVGKEGRRILKEWTADYSYDRQNRWKNEQVKVPSTESGVYILEGEHEGVTMSVTLIVTRYGLVTKAAAGRLLCFAQDRATSKPVEGLQVRVLNREHPVQGATGADGLFVTEKYRGGVLVGLKDGEFVTADAHGGGAQDAHPLIHVTTDRPIYRPNQTVYFRVVHRIETGQRLEVKPGEKLWIEIRDAKGNKVYDRRHEVNEFGSTNGQFTLGDEPPLGEYTLFTRSEKDDPNLHQHQWRWAQGWGGQPQNFGKFRVDEYRKPEYRVDVAFKKSPVIQGEDVQATVEAKYYFGSPVVEAEVKYQVYRRHHGWAWRCWDFYYDWYAEEEDEGYPGEGKRRFRGWGLGEQVLQGVGKTDREGRFEVRFPAQKWDHDAVYTVAAEVTDLSRRVVHGAGVLKATRAEFGLAMTLNKYVYKPGEKMNARVKAMTADDKPVPGTTISIKGYERRWDGGKHQDEMLFEGTSRTDAQGVAEFNFTPEREGGYLHLVAEARDRKGNAVSAQHWAWICGNNWSGDHVNLNGVDLILDKKTYDLGETAQILVTSQFKNVTLLFTVEGKEIHHYEVLPVKGHTKRVELKIDRPEYAPNVFVGVTAIKENQIVQRQRMLVVNPSAKFVSVALRPDKAQYRPRQKARYEVESTGADGRPVAAEVALGIVDESIYALQDEYGLDIRRHFIHRRLDQVATSSSLYYYDWGRAKQKDGAHREEAGKARMQSLRSAAEPGAPPAGGKADALEKNGRGPGQGGYAATEIRSNFADTMLWRTVTTGADGRATVEVEIPDNLTTWRATARAVTADSRFGQEAATVVSRKEMIVRLETPRFFTQNDQTVVSAIAHNYLASEKEVKIELAAEGIEMTGDRELKVRVEAGGQKRIDWKARVRSAGKAKITVKALSDEDSDAMQLSIPVLPHGAMKWDSKGGVVEGRVVEKVRVPEGAVREGTELVVVVSPTHASMVLEALEYLAGYPYGCVEQTMSRFLPTVVVSQALQKLGIENRELKAELPAMVAAGLQRLYNFQQADGGWGWWQNDRSSPWTTAYVVMGLAMARDADHPVDGAVLARGIQALQHHLGQAKDANTQAYVLHALSLAGSRNDTVRDQLTDRLGELNGYSKALLALALAKDGRSAKDVLAALSKDAKVVGASVHFEGSDRGGWLDHSMEVTAAALRAFVRLDPKNELVPRMVHWLSTVRQGNYWASTKQTAMVVFALVDSLAATGDLNPDMTLTLSLNGDRVFSQRVTKETWQKFDGMRKFAAARLRPGENEIAIEKAGSGSPVYSVFLKYYAEAEDLQPSQGGIQVERTYSRVVREGGKRVLQRIESGETVASGDEIEVTLQVSADRDYEWLMLEDPLPSGCEPIREYWGHHGWGRWSYWYSRKEFRDEKVSIAMTTLGRGRHTASYVMRAETPGDFHVLPAAVFNMYHPEIGGNSAEFRIRVKDR